MVAQKVDKASPVVVNAGWPSMKTRNREEASVATQKAVEMPQWRQFLGHTL
jgi:hypothetical protein